jgi:hypothetical protein
MISYSVNWMGPVSIGWYEDNNVPYVLRTTDGTFGPPKEYKHFTESYSCGRIDIYGLDNEEYWGGKHEYSLGVMRTEDWNAFGDWLDKLETSSLWTYEELICNFEKYYDQLIRWNIKGGE